MHILLTIYLMIILIVDAFAVRNYMINISNETNFENITLLILSILDIYFTVLLFKWNKWGLYGLGISSLFMFVYNLINGSGFLLSLLGLFGFVIICVLLFLRKDGKSGYENLQ